MLPTAKVVNVGEVLGVDTLKRITSSPFNLFQQIVIGKLRSLVFPELELFFKGFLTGLPRKTPNAEKGLSRGSSIISTEPDIPPRSYCH